MENIMPKILWLSPVSLHDITSGAALHCRCMLDALSKCGFEIIALTSFAFEHERARKVVFSNIDQLFEQNPNKKIFELTERKVRYLYVRSTAILQSERKLQEQNEFFESFLEILNRFKPDLVMGFGKSADCVNCFAEAKRQGIKTVYWLLSNLEHQYSFPNCDLILSDSYFTAKEYAHIDHINVIPIGAFIEKAQVLAKHKDPLFVTLINPDFKKGLAIFAKLAHYCSKARPELKFLVINSQFNFVEQITKLHDKGDINSHPYRAKDFANVLMADATFDMRLVYEKTKVLSLPLLRYESWCRVGSEALLNNIPILASNVGALSEVIGQGGILLDPPEHCLKDPLSIPSDEEIKPWFDALEQLLNNNWEENTQKAIASINKDVLTANLVKLLLPLCDSFDRYRTNY